MVELKMENITLGEKLEQMSLSLERKQREMEELKSELLEVKQMLLKNSDTDSQVKIDMKEGAYTRR